MLYLKPNQKMSISSYQQLSLVKLDISVFFRIFKEGRLSHHGNTLATADNNNKLFNVDIANKPLSATRVIDKIIMQHHDNVADEVWIKIFDYAPKTNQYTERLVLTISKSDFINGHYCWG